jgi:Dehydroquinase class II
MTATRFHQTNAEHQLLDWIHEARENASGIVINLVLSASPRSRFWMPLTRSSRQCSKSIFPTSTGASRASDAGRVRFVVFLLFKPSAL